MDYGSDGRTYLGLGIISGTSADGIDTALISIKEIGNNWQMEFLGGQTYAYPHDLRQEILDLCGGAKRSLRQIMELDRQISLVLSESALQLSRELKHQPDFISSHGQTVWHCPPQGDQLGYSWQMGRGDIIAHHTGITTISNFRQGDMAVGGQGAPLVSIVDFYLLRHDHIDRVAQNIGGISNCTYLPQGCTLESVRGWDNAPGNVLIDLAMTRLYGKLYDVNGAVARSGTIHPELVNAWLKDEFLQLPPPKSTGREWFSPAYLEQKLKECAVHNLSHPDIIATLTEFTARSIRQSYDQFLPCIPPEIIISGGGVHNQFLLDRLSLHLAPSRVLSCEQLGINADYKEAIAFALLGYLRLKGYASNLPQVTGAQRPVSLGEIYVPPHTITDEIVFAPFPA
jgi:anhydro-N-acetylmuramic acid kinase